jgi:hypothetical protein
MVRHMRMSSFPLISMYVLYCEYIRYIYVQDVTFSTALQLSLPVHVEFGVEENSMCTRLETSIEISNIFPQDSPDSTHHVCIESPL